MACFGVDLEAIHLSNSLFVRIGQHGVPRGILEKLQVPKLQLAPLEIATVMRVGALAYRSILPREIVDSLRNELIDHFKAECDRAGVIVTLEPKTTRLPILGRAIDQRSIVLIITHRLPIFNSKSDSTLGKPCTYANWLANRFEVHFSCEGRGEDAYKVGFDSVKLKIHATFLLCQFHHGSQIESLKNQVA